MIRESAANGMRRASFQFAVNGTSRQGILYVTLSYDPAEIEATIFKARKIASRRSGDHEPLFVRIERPRR